MLGATSNLPYTFELEDYSDKEIVPWLTYNVGPKLPASHHQSFTHWRGEGWEMRYVLDSYDAQDYFTPPKHYWIVKIKDPAKAFLFKLTWKHTGAHTAIADV